MSEKTLEQMLNVGVVYVDVGYDLGGVPAARTDSNVFGVVDLGGEISVSLPEFYFEVEVDGIEAGSKEMWAELLVSMREMLARCWILCEMEFVDDFYGHEVSGEEEKNLGAAITELGDDFRRITAADALSAVIKREVRDDQFRDRVRFILELFEEEAKRRGLSPEEKERLTLGDVFVFGAGDEDDEEEDQ